MLTAFSSLTTLLLVVFLAYIAMILVPFLKYPRTPPGDPASFDFHIFVPCRDEQAVIAATVVRARADFPSAHLWVIDDDSDDDTAAIVSQLVSQDTHVHLVQRRRPEARTGKGDALNAAYVALDRWLPAGTYRDRVIVAVVDADGELAPNALAVCSSAEVFGDKWVGAVQVSVWMKNRDDLVPYPGRSWIRNRFARWLLRMQDIEFRTVIAAMQSLRARTGTVGLGGNGQFTRLSTLDAIADRYGEPWHGALLEDYELGLHVLLSGYTIKHVYDTHVSQEALPSLRRLLAQRTRWTQGNIQCIRYLPEIFRSRHFDASGLMETGYYLLLPFVQVVGFVTYSIIFLTILQSWMADPAYRAEFTGMFGWLALLSFLFGVLPFALWGPIYTYRCEPELGWGRGLLYGFGLWLYVYYCYVCIARAFGRVVLGRNGWAKTRRNADAPASLLESSAIER